MLQSNIIPRQEIKSLDELGTPAFCGLYLLCAFICTCFFSACQLVVQASLKVHKTFQALAEAYCKFLPIFLHCTYAPLRFSSQSFLAKIHHTLSCFVCTLHARILLERCIRYLFLFLIRP